MGDLKQAGQGEMMQAATRERMKRWVRRAGWTAVIFYTVKGLFWLAVGLGAWSYFQHGG